MATENGSRGTEATTPVRRRRRVPFGRGKEEAENVEALENVSSPTTPHGTPLLERLVQLEQQMSTLEEKYSPRGLAAQWHSPGSPSSLIGSPTTPSSLERRCRPAKSVLQETESKGTLVERVQKLEQRLSQHRMELEEAFSRVLQEAPKHSKGLPGGGPKIGGQEPGNPEALEPLAHHDNIKTPKAAVLSENSETIALEKPAEEPANREVQQSDIAALPDTSDARASAVIEKAGIQESTEDEFTEPLLGTEREEGVSTKAPEVDTKDFIPEETIASETSTDLAPTAVPAEALEREDVGKSETVTAVSEESVMAPTEEQTQKMESLEGGAVEKRTIESAPEHGKAPSSLTHEEVEQVSRKTSENSDTAAMERPAEEDINREEHEESTSEIGAPFYPQDTQAGAVLDEAGPEEPPTGEPSEPLLGDEREEGVSAKAPGEATRPDETLASETSRDFAATAVPAEAVVRDDAGKSETSAASEDPVVAPTEEQAQKVESLEGGAAENHMTESALEPVDKPFSLAQKEAEQKPILETPSADSPEEVRFSENTETAALQRPAEEATNGELHEEPTSGVGAPADPQATYAGAVTEEAGPNKPPEEDPSEPLLGTEGEEGVSTKAPEEATKDSRPEETLASETSKDLAPTAVPAEAVEKGYVGKRETNAASEEPVVAPTEEQVQELEGLEGGAVDKSMTEESSPEPVEEPSSLAHKEVEEKSVEEPKMPSAVSPEEVGPSENNGTAALEQPTEESMDGEVHQEPTIAASSSPSNTHADEGLGVNEPTRDEPTEPLLGSAREDSVSTKALGEAIKGSRAEAALASGTSTDLAPMAVPAEAVEREDLGKSDTVAAASEEPVVAPTEEQAQKMESLGGGSVEKPTIESAPELVKQPSSLARKEVEQKKLVKAFSKGSARKPGYITKPQPLTKKEKKKKHYFKDMRERVQRYFATKPTTS